jgi:hypothetical protein
MPKFQINNKISGNAFDWLIGLILSLWFISYVKMLYQLVSSNCIKTGRTWKDSCISIYYSDIHLKQVSKTTKHLCGNKCRMDRDSKCVTTVQGSYSSQRTWNVVSYFVLGPKRLVGTENGLPTCYMPNYILEAVKRSARQVSRFPIIEW